MAMGLIYMSLSTRLLFFIVFVIFHLGLNRQEIDFFFRACVDFGNFKWKTLKKTNPKKVGLLLSIAICYFPLSKTKNIPHNSIC